jgi:Protein of unknown function (DUF3631)
MSYRGTPSIASHDAAVCRMIRGANLRIRCAGLHGKELDARGLGRLLERYHVKSTTFDLQDGSGKKAKGYTTYPTRDNDGLADVWNRWLPTRGQSGNGGNCSNDAGEDSYRADSVTDASVTWDDEVTALNSADTTVTEVTGSGDEGHKAAELLPTVTVATERGSASPRSSTQPIPSPGHARP